MLKKVTSDDKTGSFYYDENGQRFLKVNEDNNVEIKTYYIGNTIIEEERDNGLLINTTTTKYIKDLDGKLVASVETNKESSTSLAGQVSNAHISTAGLYSFDSLKGAYLKTKHLILGYSHKSNFIVTMFNIMLLIVTLTLFTRYICGVSISVKKRTAHGNGWNIKHYLKIGSYYLQLIVDRKNSDNITRYVQQKRWLPGSALLILFTFLIQTGCVPTPVETEILFYHLNHLSSPALVTDEDGNEVQRINYKPYGEIEQRFTGVYNPETGDIEQFEDTLTFKFTGKEFDDETSLYYFNARYYDPQIGSFTTADNIIPEPDTSYSYNRYMYVAGNPIIYVDPDGEFAVSALLLTALISGGINYVCHFVFRAAPPF